MTFQVKLHRTHTLKQLHDNHDNHRNNDVFFYFYVCYSHSSVILGSDYVTFTELQNSTELTLTIHFVGEPGQVTRLFPQSILRGMGYPLDLKVSLKVCIGLVSQLNELAKPLSRSDRPGY